MSAELPALSAVVARLDNPEINLAAYGGIVFPLALIIESPVIMLLAASTALCKDWASFRLMYKVMMWLGGLLTLLHVLVAFTPIYDVVVIFGLHAPKEIVEPARIGLMIMTPWTWSIAYRRFHQGVLIRFNNSRAVGIGTIIRLGTNCLILFAGYRNGNISGIVVATLAVSCGVISEAIYTGFVVRPVLRNDLKMAPKVEPPLTYQAFADFYFPLVLTSLIALLANPIGSAAIGRMPDSLNSLAVWPVISGLVFMFRSAGIAFNEVVVALIDQPGAFKKLRNFTYLLIVATTVAILILVLTPLSFFWFFGISALSLSLAKMAISSLWLVLPLPAIAVLQSWYQGAILNNGQTTGITEAVIVYLVSSSLILGIGILAGQGSGLVFGLAALTVGSLIQTAWLWYRSKHAMTTFQSLNPERADFSP
jgi:hypothetical protein